MSNLSDTKKFLLKEISEILKTDFDNKKIKNFQITQNNILIILNDVDNVDNKDTYENLLVGKIYKKLLPKVKEKIIANLPILNIAHTQNGIKIEL